MLNWSQQEIDWYLAAEEQTDYFQRLAGAIAELLPVGAMVHDLGCGIGSLALPLARLGFLVTAVDSHPAAVAMVRRRAAAQGLPIKVQQADYTTLMGPVPYPVFCLCGDLTQELPLLRQWQSHHAVVITPDANLLGFCKAARPRRAVASRQVADFLAQQGIPNRAQPLTAAFGQPLPSREAGLAFLAHHNPGLSQQELTSLLEQWAVAGDSTAFPLQLPAIKQVTLFSLNL